MLELIKQCQSKTVALQELSWTVAGVQLVNSSDLPSMLEAGDSQLSTCSCLISINDTESFMQDRVKLA